MNRIAPVPLILLVGQVFLPSLAQSQLRQPTNPDINAFTRVPFTSWYKIGFTTILVNYIVDMCESQLSRHKLSQYSLTIRSKEKYS